VVPFLWNIVVRIGRINAFIVIFNLRFMGSFIHRRVHVDTVIGPGSVCVAKCKYV